MISRRVTADLTTYMDRRQVEAPKLISRLVTADLTTYMDTQQTKRPLVSYGEEQTQEGWFTKNSSVPRTGKSLVKTKNSSSFKLGKFALEYTKGTGAWQACVQWPNWLSGSIYEVASNPSPSGWMYHYRVYNIVPQKSEIITKIETGDKNGVLELFSTRKASPFDKDPKGRSLLYYAAKKRNYDICKLLLRMGLDECLVVPPESRLGCPLVPLLEDSFKREGEKEKTRRQQLVELFNSYIDGLESTLVLRIFDFIVNDEYDNGYITSFQKSFLPKLHTSPLRYRLEAFRLGSFHVNLDSHVLGFLSDDGQVPAGDVEQSTREQLSLVHSAALALGIRFVDKILFPKNTFPVYSVYSEYWSELAQKVASAAGDEDLNCIETITPWDVYHVPVWRGTPLISAIGGALCYMSPDIEFDLWDEVLQGTVQKWVLNLQTAGVDLIEYGRREVLAMEQVRGALDADAIVLSRTRTRPIMTEGPRTTRPGPTEMRRWNETHWVPVRLLSLDIGPRPEDWRLVWAPEFEWMAKQFWELIEKEDIVMPGSWVES